MSDEIRVLHAIRLLGFADMAAIAARSCIPESDLEGALADAERSGWVQHSAFAGLAGWALTDAGRARNESQLAEERHAAGATGVVAAAYREFLTLNERLVRAVTDWQLAPSQDDPLAPNDHEDSERDARILAEVAKLSDELRSVQAGLVEVLPRFSGYAERFDEALRRARAGEAAWIDRTDVDSCHRVWFELHEDLLATLGIDRASG